MMSTSLMSMVLPHCPLQMCFTLTQDFPETFEAEFLVFHVVAWLWFQTISALESKRQKAVHAAHCASVVFREDNGTKGLRTCAHFLNPPGVHANTALLPTAFDERKETRTGVWKPGTSPIPCTEEQVTGNPRSEIFLFMQFVILSHLSLWTICPISQFLFNPFTCHLGKSFCSAWRCHGDGEGPGEEIVRVDAKNTLPLDPEFHSSQDVHSNF